MNVEYLRYFDQDFSDIAEVLEVENDISSRNRIFKNRPNYLEELNDKEFFERFRMSKEDFLIFLQDIRVYLEPKSLR
jgi:hypothetical protein